MFGRELRGIKTRPDTERLGEDFRGFDGESPASVCLDSPHFLFFFDVTDVAAAAEILSSASSYASCTYSYGSVINRPHQLLNKNRSNLNIKNKTRKNYYHETTEKSKHETLLHLNVKQ